MHCTECVFFKTWRSFAAGMCEVTKKPAEPMDKPCEKFTPRGIINEWGEKTIGGSCR
ncbi:MAG: hypothetical protein PHP51_07775 [Desulfotomaculaceae bacterium]|nr:hypothetical protein [Desulfotomaculaceae bacterium]MDD4767977.1 hypothetical protein [Desulfotomaculaceae bacterium]